MLRKISNPPNCFTNQELEWLDVPPESQLEVFEERAKTIISKNKSPDIGFNYSINPYRGCFHACAYCYARPSHQYLDFGAGTDFERKIVVKMNAPDLLSKELSAKSWPGERIIFSGNTDCYQPLEMKYELTRRLLEICLKFNNPVSIITKGALVTRDIDILKDFAESADAQVIMSLAFSDDNHSKLIEPNAPRPSRRFRAIKELADSGISVGLALAPIIPGLNETQIPEILSRAKDAGVSNAFMTLIRLPAELKEVFSERIAEAFPTRSKKILNGIMEMKGGALNRSVFGQRMVGTGERWNAVEWLFYSNCEKLRIETTGRSNLKVSKALKKKEKPAQLNLFE